MCDVHEILILGILMDCVCLMCVCVCSMVLLCMSGEGIRAGGTGRGNKGEILGKKLGRQVGKGGIRILASLTILAISTKF